MATLTKSTGTVSLSGTVEKVTFPAVYGWVWVKNMSDADMFVGLSESVSAGADGVMRIPAGECGRIQTDGQDSVYLMGTGNALVVAQNYSDCPFKLAAKGGEVPDLSAYAKTADVPNIKVNAAVDADTVNGHTVNADVPADAVFTDTVPDLSLYAKKTDIPTELPANGGNADTLSSKNIDYFMHWRNETIVNPDDVTNIGIYQWSTPTTNTIVPIAYGTLIVSNAFGYKCQIAIGADTSVFVRHKTYDQEWSAWRNVSDGGSANYATNAGNAEKLGGKDASAYSTSIIKSVTFSAATTNGYIWTGIAFPKYIVGIDLEYFDVIVQYYKGNHVDAARDEWAMMFFSKDDVTTPLNGSFNGVIYYID